MAAELQRYKKAIHNISLRLGVSEEQFMDLAITLVGEMTAKLRRIAD